VIIGIQNDHVAVGEDVAAGLTLTLRNLTVKPKQACRRDGDEQKWKPQRNHYGAQVTDIYNAWEPHPIKHTGLGIPMNLQAPDNGFPRRVQQFLQFNASVPDEDNNIAHFY